MCRGAKSLRCTFVPQLSLGRPDYIVAIVAVLGTTISPYLFFWQASQEAEDEQDRPDGTAADRGAGEAPGASSRASASIPMSAWAIPT